MNPQLPPRRPLPPEIKERMRPVLPVPKPNRPSRRMPLVAAAAVALLAAGAVYLIPTSPQPELATGTTVRPTTATASDIARCRSAMSNAAWQVRTAIVLPVRTLLYGNDGRFCELGRSTATVSAPDAKPYSLGQGSILYRSRTIVAGIPPLGSSRMSALSGAQQLDTLWTRDLFVVDALRSGSPNGSLALDFDTGRSEVRWDDMPREPASVDSFPNGEKWTPENLLARCLDNALLNRSATGLETDWNLIAQAGADIRHGILLAGTPSGEWGQCEFTPTGGGSLNAYLAITLNATGFHVLDSVPVGGRLTVTGAVGPHVASVELTVAGVAGTKVAPVGGGFVVQAPASAGIDLYGPAVQLTLRSADGSQVYRGKLRP